MSKSLSSIGALMSIVAGCMPISDRTTYTIRLPKFHHNKYMVKNPVDQIVRNKGKRLSGNERNEICPCCGWFKKKKCNCIANLAQRSESD